MQATDTSRPARLPLASLAAWLGRARAWVRANPHRVVLAVLAVIMFLLSLGVVPFLVERTSPSWIVETNRQDDPDRPLTVYERYEQFNIDINHWIALTRQFPGQYNHNTNRINRPLYPAVASLVPRLITLAEHFPDWRSGLTAPTSLRLAFLSMLAWNLGLLILSLQLFYSWLKRHLPVNIAFIAALFLALDDHWLTSAAQVSTAPLQVFITVIVVYLFDRTLLAEQPPTWRTLIGVSLLIGTLFLGAMTYAAIFACWLWAAYCGRWRVVGVSLVVQAIPTLLWMGITRAAGWEYFNLEVTQYRQGVWALDLIRAGEWQAIYPRVIDLADGLIGGLVNGFGLITLALAALGFSGVGNLVNDRYRHLALLGFAGNLLFWIIAAAPGGGRLYTVFIIIYPLAAVGLYWLIQHAAHWLEARLNRPQVSAAAGAFGLFFILHTALMWRYHTVNPNSYRWDPALDQVAALVQRLSDLLAQTGPGY